MTDPIQLADWSDAHKIRALENRLTAAHSVMAAQARTIAKLSTVLKIAGEMLDALGKKAEATQIITAHTIANDILEDIYNGKN